MVVVEEYPVELVLEPSDSSLPYSNSEGSQAEW